MNDVTTQNELNIISTDSDSVKIAKILAASICFCFVAYLSAKYNLKTELDHTEQKLTITPLSVPSTSQI